MKEYISKLPFVALAVVVLASIGLNYMVISQGRQVRADADLTDIMRNERQLEQTQSKNDEAIENARRNMSDADRAEVGSVQDRLRRLHNED